jgi:hypothetical protein
MVMIVRLDTRTVHVVVPHMQTYAERSLDDPMLDGMVMDAGDGSDIRIEELGSEVRNGEETTKYGATGTDANGREIGGVYWQTDEGIIVEASGYTVRDGQRVEGRIVLSNVAIGQQDPSLFEPPAGYASGPGTGVGTATAPAAGQGAVQDMMIDAMRKQGMSEAQIQQMLKQLEKIQGQ